MSQMDYWREHWAKRNAISEASTAAGEVTITSRRKRCQVHAPLNPEFVDGANALGGRWRPKTKVWTFSIRSIHLVVELCVRVYGRDAIKVKGSE